MKWCTYPSTHLDVIFFMPYPYQLLSKSHTPKRISSDLTGNVSVVLPRFDLARLGCHLLASEMFVQWCKPSPTVSVPKHRSQNCFMDLFVDITHMSVSFPRYPAAESLIGSWPTRVEYRGFRLTRNTSSKQYLTYATVSVINQSKYLLLLASYPEVPLEPIGEKIKSVELDQTSLTEYISGSINLGQMPQVESPCFRRFAIIIDTILQWANVF